MSAIPAQLCGMDRAQPITPLLVNGEGARSPQSYLAAVAQLAAARNPRYAPAGKTTFCNILAWDASLAMEAPLPHWVFPDGSIAPPHARNAMELNCNGLDRFLRSPLPGAPPWLGWQSLGTDEALARATANQGRPTFALWRNPAGGPGHIAPVMPSPPGGPTLITQAGSRCFELEPLVHGFQTVRPVTFWSHP